MSMHRRSGFTWVELVVIVCVLALLMATLLPAVRQSHGPSRRNTCNNNLHQLGLAATNYVSFKGEYPGYLESLPTDRDGDISNGRASRVAWLVPLLPYIERQDIYDLYRSGDYLMPDAVAEWDPRRVYTTALICPSAAVNGQSNALRPPCNFIANTGRADVYASAGTDDKPGWPNDWRANGVFFNHYRDGVALPADAPLVSISGDFITEHDGSSLTLMLSERIEAATYSFPPDRALDAEASLGFVWWPSASDQPPFAPPRPSQRINGPNDVLLPINNARPTSNHPTGVNAAFCDGHTRFISQDIDYGVWCLLMTPHGAEANTPGEVELEPPGPTNNYQYLRAELVDEASMQ